MSNKYRCAGCGYGLAYRDISRPLIVCEECKTKQRLAWTADKGWQLEVIPEAPEGEGCKICRFCPCRCEDIIRHSENKPCGVDNIDVQYPR